MCTDHDFQVSLLENNDKELNVGHLIPRRFCPQPSQAKQNQQQELITAVEVSKVTAAPVSKASSPGLESARPKASSPVSGSPRSKSSSPGPESPRPKTEGEAEFSTVYESLQKKMADFESSVATQGQLLDSDFTDNIEANIEVCGGRPNRLLTVLHNVGSDCSPSGIMLDQTVHRLAYCWIRPLTVWHTVVSDCSPSGIMLDQTVHRLA